MSGLKQPLSYYTLSLLKEEEKDGGFYRLTGFKLGTSGAIYPYDYTISSYGTATFANKTINTSDNKITCIKIDKSKFMISSLK